MRYMSERPIEELSSHRDRAHSLAMAAKPCPPPVWIAAFIANDAGLRSSE